MKLSEEEVVIAGNQLNPGAFSQIMLRDQGLIDGSEGGIFTPGLVQVTTEQFELMVLTDRLQFRSPEGPQQADIIRDKLGRVVRSLPYTPYTSVSMNFFWSTEPGAKNMESLSRRLFLNDKCPIADEFQDGDPRFGAYFSKNIFGTRLKLTVLPKYIIRKGAEFLYLAFSFHRDLSSAQAVDEIYSSIAMWRDAKDYSTKLAAKLDWPS